MRGTKDYGLMTYNTGMVKKFGKKDLQNILVSFTRVRKMVKEGSFGRMVAIMKEIL